LSIDKEIVRSDFVYNTCN